jgi:hypothetical protein
MTWVILHWSLASELGRLAGPYQAKPAIVQTLFDPATKRFHLAVAAWSNFLCLKLAFKG